MSSGWNVTCGGHQVVLWGVTRFECDLWGSSGWNVGVSLVWNVGVSPGWNVGVSPG